MNKVYNIENLKLHFESNASFNVEDIYLFYKEIEPDIRKKTVLQRVFVLLKNGFLVRIARGLYGIGKTCNYTPVLENEIKELYVKLSQKFPLLNFCIWNTKQYNEFMIHQPAQFYTVIETDKDNAEYVFHFMQNLEKQVFFNPKKEEVDKYLSVVKNCFVVKNLISEAPIQKIDNIPTITLEKLLVDAFCDVDLYTTQQGSESETIFLTAFEKYTINKSKLFRYAARRKRKAELIDFLEYLEINYNL